MLLVTCCFIHSLVHPTLLRAEIPIKGRCMDDHFPIFFCWCDKKRLLCRCDIITRIVASTTGIVMLPIFEPTPGEEHWTLMIIDKRGGPMQADLAVRYYDTLTKESMASRLIAAKILKEMCPGHPEVRLPRRRNCSQQGALACGLAVIWYMEEVKIRKKGR